VLVLDRYWIKIGLTICKSVIGIDSRYLDNRSFVLRMMNLVTRPPSSLSFFSHWACTSALALASRPRIMAFSKFLRKLSRVPRKSGFAKLRREKYSERSFWTGVPVRMTRLLTLSEFKAWNVWLPKTELFNSAPIQFPEFVSLPEFFSLCPSSQSRRPMLQLAKCAVRVRSVSYETIITDKNVNVRHPSSRSMANLAV